MRLLILFSLLLGLGACMSRPSTQPVQTDPLAQASAISVTLPGFKTDSGTTLRWYSSPKWVGDTGQPHLARKIQHYLREEFTSKGYLFVPEGEQAHYDVLLVVLQGELAEAPDVMEIFHLYPDLAGNPEGYSKGTVLVAIAPSGTRDIVWRSAMEVFTTDELTAAQRDMRMQWGARKLLDSVPGYH